MVLARVRDDCVRGHKPTPREEEVLQMVPKAPLLEEVMLMVPKPFEREQVPEVPALADHRHDRLVSQRQPEYDQPSMPPR